MGRSTTETRCVFSCYLSILYQHLLIYILGVLPPIKHKLSTAIENFPVIPPIAAKRSTSSSRETSSVRSVHSSSQNEDVQQAPDSEIKSRNRHLLKVYLVSLIQLLLVLLIVASFSEVRVFLEFQRQHRWIGSFVIGLMLAFMCIWVVVIVCFPWIKQTPKYNCSILFMFTIFEGILLGETNVRCTNVSMNCLILILILGVMSVDTRQSGYQYRGHYQINLENGTNYNDMDLIQQRRANSRANTDILFPDVNETGFENETNSGIDNIKNIENLTIVDLYEAPVSTATLAVTYCVIVCSFFVLLSLQNRLDGDFMGGLVHTIIIIIITISIVMFFVKRTLWPRLWFAGFGAFFLWFFHRMVVFPLIALIFPFSRSN